MTNRADFKYDQISGSTRRNLYISQSVSGMLFLDVFRPSRTQNYPIFLLSLIDSLVTGPGCVWQFITKQFVVHQPSNFPDMFFTQAPKFYSNMRSVLQRALQIPITENVNPFLV